MDGKHPNDIDPRPKRRRDKYNPYKIYSVGASTDSPHYYVSFNDGEGVQHDIEIDKKLYDTLNQFELDDLSFIHEVDNHYDLTKYTEEELTVHAFEPPTELEEDVLICIRDDALHKAIMKLPKTQRRRLTLRYFFDLTYDQIAQREGCSRQAVQDSIRLAKEFLKNFLKNF